MNASGYRKLVFGCVITGLAFWLGVSQLLPDVGPPEAGADDVGLEVVDEILSAFSDAKPPISPFLQRKWQNLEAADWPADPFSAGCSPFPDESSVDQQRHQKPSGQQPRLVLKRSAEDAAGEA